MAADQSDWIDAVSWGADGLVPAIAQQQGTGNVLTLAWMNKQALQLTVDEGRAVYWSRSRNKIWRKGELSGHRQDVIEIRLDCDHDAILLIVNQQGKIACHSGRESCFYLLKTADGWCEAGAVMKDPKDIYPR